ncbi:hypothetical protein EUX98_g6068 [Antrodiella citrinella]|uniref:Uncharacterized protein n=1 Tax=Antrodiella citrinella TaxID=2447956 RepID=A0A4S4MRS8_9APHY|nr:hypothetical protein EUX98_g6068 [Antrodiella citrinella]
MRRTASRTTASLPPGSPEGFNSDLEDAQEVEDVEKALHVEVLTVDECLTERLGGKPPPMLTTRVASSTRGLTQTEVLYTPTQQLKWVASHHAFVSLAKDKLCAHPKFQAFSRRELHPTDLEGSLLMHSLHPNSTGKGLPSEIHSESDSTSHILSKLAHPAAWAIQCTMQEGTAAIPSIPYVSSCSGKKGSGIPDAVLISDGSHVAKGLGEWKTANSLPAKTLKDVLTFLSSLESTLNVPFRFWWGTQSGPSSASDESSKITKILCQLWGQQEDRPDAMVTCLSSFDVTVFCYRHPEERNLLLLSDAIPHAWITVMDFMAVFALSLGITKLEKEDLPKLDRANWATLDDFYTREPQLFSGLDVRRNVPMILQQHSAKLKSEAAERLKNKRKKITVPASSRKLRSKGKVEQDEDDDDDMDGDITPRPKKRNVFYRSDT